MNKGTVGYKFILAGNVLHSFIFTILLIENVHTSFVYYYAVMLLLLFPNIIFYKKCKETTKNIFSNYFIVIGLLLTIGFVGLFYIVGGLLVNRYNNMTREELRMKRVNL